MSQAWKALERRKCTDLGGKRRGQVAGTGWAKGSDDDGSLPVSLQVKRTRRYSLRHSWIEQARRDSRADGRPWVLSVDEHNDRYGGIAILPWPFLVELVNWYFDGPTTRRERLYSALGPAAKGFDRDAHIRGILAVLKDRGA